MKNPKTFPRNIPVNDLITYLEIARLALKSWVFYCRQLDISDEEADRLYNKLEKEMI